MGFNDKKYAQHKTMAECADKYICYEKSVQCVEAEIDFVDQTFVHLRQRQARRLREDFCGTTNTSCEWVRRHKKNYAISVDLDNEVLDWGKRHKISQLTESQQKRLDVIQADVLTVNTNPVDIVLAMNFSYWLLKKRDLTIQYFKKIYRTLVQDGIFFLDAYGGYEAFQEIAEETKYGNFTYIWDQYSYNPITGIAKNHIHFKFTDGSWLKQAFSYKWRLWTLPELLEMLTVAGFKTTVYWEQADENGEGNGIFLPTTKGEADAGWIAYLVAEKK